MTFSQLTIEEAISDRQRATIGEILSSVDEQQENLSRVKNRLAAHVLRFCQGIGVQGRFHATDLLQAVTRAVAPIQISPDSPVRVLRDLRQSGELDYCIESRRRSLYRIVKITEQRPKEG